MIRQLQDLLDRFAAMRIEDLQMSEWLPMLIVLSISCLAAMALSLLYSVFFERRSTGSDIHRAFPALGTAITGIFICLQFSLPLSLGLLGALSIVRFRTPIKEPEEIGFLMLLIASSICCATLNFLLLGILLTMMVVVMAAMRWMPWFYGRRTAVGCLVVTAPTAALEAALPAIRSVIRAATQGTRLEAITDCEGTSTATITLFRGNGEILTRLQQSVRELLGRGDVSLFLQRPQAF